MIQVGEVVIQLQKVNKSLLRQSNLGKVVHIRIGSWEVARLQTLLGNSLIMTSESPLKMEGQIHLRDKNRHTNKNKILSSLGNPLSRHRCEHIVRILTSSRLLHTIHKA